MGAITDKFANTFRDYRTLGVPATGANEPVKSEIRAIGPLIEAAIATAGFGNAVTVVKATRADLNADLAHPAGTVALVYADAADADNDLYFKAGSSGSGSWTLTGALHGVVGTIVEQNGGRYVYTLRTVASTNDALDVTTEGGVPVNAYRAFDLYVVNVTGPNTTATPTFSIDGLPAKTMRTARGNVLPIPFYDDGTHLAMRYDVGADEFRILFSSPGAMDEGAAFLTFTPSSDHAYQFEGDVSPTPLEDPTKIIFAHRVSQVHTVDGAGVYYRIPQFVDELRMLKHPNGAEVFTYAWEANDTLLVRPTVDSNYELIAVLSGAVGGRVETDDRRSFYTMRTNQIAALAAMGG